MRKPRNIFILLLVLIFGALIFLEATIPQPIDWSYSYSKVHKKPFGAKVFDEIYSQNLEAKSLNKSIYESIKEDSIQGNVLFFNTSLSIGETDAKVLLDWVTSGNTAFISAEYAASIIIDTLKLDKEGFNFSDQLSYKPSFKTDSLNSKAYPIGTNLNVQYFKNVDSLDLEVLGYTYLVNKDSTEIKQLPNFIKTEFGEGKLYLHLFPQAFSNFFLVDKDNYNYTETILKHLDYSKDLYVDQYYKDQKQKVQKGVLDYLLTNKYLKWAYYLLLFMTVIYILFEGKRTQKPIEVRKPYANKTYEFTKTIAEMYISKNDHLSIATMQIEHFLDHVRDVYRISTRHLNEEFVRQLASKSGKDTRTIQALLKRISKIENSSSISKEELKQLEKLISHIKS